MENRIKINKREKMNRALLSSKPSAGIRRLVESGEMREIAPEIFKMIGFKQFSPYHDSDVYEHTLRVLDNVEPKLNLRLAALFHDIAKPDCLKFDEKGIGHFKYHSIFSASIASVVMKRLGYSEKLIINVCKLIKLHYIKDIRTNKITIDQYVGELGVENIEDMINLCRSDVMGKSELADMSKVDELEITLKKFQRNIRKDDKY